jgi:hypothetical protein
MAPLAVPGDDGQPGSASVLDYFTSFAGQQLTSS